MNFEKAYHELLNGKRIRRKAWDPLMHLAYLEKQVKTFTGEFTNYYGNADILTSKGWKVMEGDNKELNFLEALEELKLKKKLTNNLWGEHIFIFVDGDNIAMCKPVAFDFMPTFKCFCANDWEVMK